MEADIADALSEWMPWMTGQILPNMDGEGHQHVEWFGNIYQAWLNHQVYYDLPGDGSAAWEHMMLHCGHLFPGAVGPETLEEEVPTLIIEDTDEPEIALTIFQVPVQHTVLAVPSLENPAATSVRPPPSSRT